MGTFLIPTDRVDVLEAGLALLARFQAQTGARGRFIALYLGLRRMAERVAPLGSATYTPVSDIEAFLDALWAKRHRPEPVVVLTAPFGGSTGPNAGYSTRTGHTAPGNRYPTNTWRNNFNVQKGVGCVADADTIGTLLANPQQRMGCPFMRYSEDVGFVCGISGTSYRGDEHSIWLAVAPAGYQVADLDEPAVYDEYLHPSGVPVPVFPLIAVVYAMALSELAIRPSVGIPEFASDFGFSLSQVEQIFDCDPESPYNRQMLSFASSPRDSFDDFVEDSEARLPELPEVMFLNSGLGAELAIARELEVNGWKVIYTGDQRLLGYDLRAERGEEVLRVEVKSSVGFTTPELTQSEWDAALRHEEEFVLAIVDFYGSERQASWFVRNPAGSMEPSIRTSASYWFQRKAIEQLRTESDLL